MHEERDRVDRHAACPGGSTGRCTPFWPPPSTNVVERRRSCRTRACRRALLAPIGSGAPTWAITTPISPAGTCTHGNFFTAKIGHSLNRSPGISSVGLVAGLASEGDGVVLAELPEREALGDEADLRRADGVERLEDDEHQDHDDTTMPTMSSTMVMGSFALQRARVLDDVFDLVRPTCPCRTTACCRVRW